MASRAPTQQPAPSTVFGRLAARHPVATFLVIAYAIGWTIFLPMVLSEDGFGLLPIHLPLTPVTSIASILALALPAFLVTAATSGKDGVRDLVRRCLRWRIGIHWYLIALLGFVIATLFVASVFLGLSPLQGLVERWPLLFTLFLPEVFVPFVLIQLWEEAGWTGFLQDTLQERHGPLLASILVAPAFALMHLPLVLLDVPRSGVAPFVLGVVVQMGLVTLLAVFFRIIIGWLYNGTGRSVLVVALFHSAYNSATSSGDARFTEELITGPAALLIPLGLTVMVAVVVAAFTKGRLSYEPERVPQRAATARS
jgi:membrane protease YdiL (CAAX protease family)